MEKLGEGVEGELILSGHLSDRERGRGGGEGVRGREGEMEKGEIEKRRWRRGRWRRGEREGEG